MPRTHNGGARVSEGGGRTHGHPKGKPPLRLPPEPRGPPSNPPKPPPNMLNNWLMSTSVSPIQKDNEHLMRKRKRRSHAYDQRRAKKTQTNVRDARWKPASSSK